MNLMILEYVLFVIIMFSLFIINRTLRKTSFTVSNYLILSFTIIIGLQVIACTIFGYKTTTMDFWLILAFFIIVSVITDIGASSFAKRVSFKGIRFKMEDNKTGLGRNEKKFNIICIIAAMYSIFHFWRIARLMPKLYYIVQDEFQNQYSSGFNFYVRVLLLIATVYYWGCSKISKKNILLGFLCLIPNILTFVKGIVFLPCLGSILLRVKNGELRVSPKVVMRIFIVGVCIFFGAYLVEMAVYNPDILFEIDTYKSIASKLIAYLISGVQSFSQNISENNVSAFRNTENVTIAPFVNSLAKLGIGKSVGTVCTIRQTIGYDSVSKEIISPNVNTYIGTLYLYNGLIKGSLLNVFWVFITSFMDELSNNSSSMISPLSGMFSAAFALGWFDYYFTHPFWIYLIVFAVVLEIIFKIKFVRKR